MSHETLSPEHLVYLLHCIPSGSSRKPDSTCCTHPYRANHHWGCVEQKRQKNTYNDSITHCFCTLQQYIAPVHINIRRPVSMFSLYKEGDKPGLFIFVAQYKNVPLSQPSKHEGLEIPCFKMHILNMPVTCTNQWYFKYLILGIFYKVAFFSQLYMWFVQQECLSEEIVHFTIHV